LYHMFPMFVKLLCTTLCTEKPATSGFSHRKSPTIIVLMSDHSIVPYARSHPDRPDWWRGVYPTDRPVDIARLAGYTKDVLHDLREIAKDPSKSDMPYRLLGEDCQLNCWEWLLRQGYKADEPRAAIDEPASAGVIGVDLIKLLIDLENIFHSQNLTDLQQDILLALFQGSHTSADSRMSQDGLLGGRQIKEPTSNLRRIGLVETKNGSGGGIWLTHRGEMVAENLKKYGGNRP